MTTRVQEKSSSGAVEVSCAGAAEKRDSSSPTASSAPMVVIHCGLHRTGTTTLQRRVFSRLGGVEYVHKPPNERWRSLRPNAGRPMVLSHEGFLMHHSDGRLRTERMMELGRRFAGARVILTLRRPDRWLRSLYTYKVFKGECCSFEEFVQRREPGKYMDYIRLIESAFGASPLILFQEELRENFEASAALIARWAGASSPPKSAPSGRLNRRSDRALSWVLWFNHHFPRPSGPGAPAKEARKKLHQVATHAVAAAGSMWPGRPAPTVVTPEAMRAVQAQHAEDWLAALRLATSQRPLMSESLQRELEARGDRFAG